jgi:peptidylprolyl isomerase
MKTPSFPRALTALAAVLSLSAAASAQDWPEAIESAPDSAWRAVDPGNTLVFTTTHGDIYVELAPEFAPNHVERLRELTGERFYDFKVWHRVIDGFMAQGGGALENPALAADKPNLEAEFTIQRGPELTITELQDRTINPRENRNRARAGFWNGFPAATQPIAQAAVTESGTVQSWLLHCQGAAAMARTNDPNSARSQFYITRDEAPHLEYLYTVWGKVRAGQDAVNAIRVGTMGETMGFRPDFIEQVRLASELPEDERLTIAVFDTDSDAFATYLDGLAEDNGGPLPNVCEIDIPVRITE